MTFIWVLVPAVCTATYLVFRQRFVKSAEDELRPFLPAENRLSWRASTGHSPQLDTDRLSIAQFERVDEQTAKQIELPAEIKGKYLPNEPDWLVPLSLSAAALDGLVQSSPHFLEFTQLKVETLKELVPKTVDLIGKIETLNAHIGDHLILAAEHGHEAWLTAMGLWLAKHLIVTSIDNAVAAHSAIAGAAEHAGSSLEALGHGAMAGALHESAASGHAGVLADAHFPFITVLLSSIREFKLVAEDKTTVVRAFTNVAVDGIGVAGGAVAGAKGGALLGGTIGGPVGMLIGGIGGAVGGAVTGRLLSTGVRFLPFKRAKDTYLSSADAARQEIDSLIEKSQADVKRLQQDKSTAFEHGRTAIVANAQQVLSAQIEACEADLKGFANAFPERLDELAQQLKTEHHLIVARIPRSLFGFIWPTRADVMRRMVNDWFRRAAESIALEHSRYQKLPEQSVQSRLGEIRRFLKHYQFELTQLETGIREVVSLFENMHTQAREIQNSAVGEVERLRLQLVKEFTARVATITNAIGKQTMQRKEEIQRLWDKLKKEADAVGVALTPDISGG